MNLGMMYPLKGSYIKICWVNGVFIISFRWRVVTPKGNSFECSWGNQTAKDKGRAIPPVTSTWGNLISCQLSRFEYNEGWGPCREVLFASLTPSVTIIFRILVPDGRRPPCKLKMVWGAWPRGSAWSKGSTTSSLSCWRIWSRLLVDWFSIWMQTRWSSNCVRSKAFLP